MTRILLVATSLSILTACSAVSPYKPDGGRVMQGCNNGTVVMPVKVLDVNGNAVSGAIVTATNRASAKTQTGTTDGNGVTNAINEDIGAGDVDLKATEGSRVSGPYTSYWTCGECDCISDPPSASLTIQ